MCKGERVKRKEKNAREKEEEKKKRGKKKKKKKEEDEGKGERECGSVIKYNFFFIAFLLQCITIDGCAL